jgi:hypothetical protein
MAGNRLSDNDMSQPGTKQQKPVFGVKLWKLDEFDLEASRSAAKDVEQSEANDRRRFITVIENGTLSVSDVELYSQQLGVQQYLASASHLANPLSDHLLYLVNYNAFRGLFLNKVTLSKMAGHISVTPERTQKVNIMMGMKQDAICVALDRSMPPHLRPTALQSRIVHANWIDFIPFPRMRDNLIMRQGEFNHRIFMSDVVGTLLEDVMLNKYGEGTGPRGPRLKSCGKASDFASDRRGMIIWGEPHWTESWEVTAEFLQTWGWAAEGCHELMKSTNQWRALRGEGPLVFETMVTEP